VTWSQREAVELFHLVFLAELGTKLDRALYAIKGGCNLRFYFGSVRYSEDLDIDVQKTAPDTLRRKVDQLLAGRSLTLTLGAHGIGVTSVTRPKHTDTTQRWKLALAVDGASAHTKIEFSRRGLSTGVEFGPADRSLLGRYGLSPLLASHYGRQAAFEQKVGALIGRSETQARDVFDLHLLLAGSADVDASRIDARSRHSAAERALSVDFRAFRSQVLAYLPPERQDDYGSREVWEQMVLQVVTVLEAEHTP
jgi:Nucleotidyl transferase AbiEii toxin, Type IV TA system